MEFLSPGGKRVKTMSGFQPLWAFIMLKGTVQVCNFMSTGTVHICHFTVKV